MIPRELGERGVQAQDPASQQQVSGLTPPLTSSKPAPRPPSPRAASALRAAG